MQFKARLAGFFSSTPSPTVVMTRLYMLAVLTCVVVVACDRVNLTAPTGSALTLTVDRSVLPLNGQATVRAVVMESAGTPVHNGTVVTFGTTLGSVEPIEAKTVNGIATAVFTAGSVSGTARITAFSGGAGNSSGAEVKIGAAAASGTISVSATPPSVSQSGGTVTVSAIVFDEFRNPLPGVQVQFTASTGALSATTAITDSNGVARTTLNTTQTSTVTAFAGAAKGEVQVTVSSAPTVTVDAPPSGTAGDPVALTLKVPAAATGTAPRQIAQVVVNLGDGTSRTFTNVTSDVGFTHTYQNPGGYTITATASDVNGNTSISSDSIVIGFAPQPTVTLTSNKNVVSMNPATDNGVATLTVSASAGTNGAPIRDVRVTAQDGSVVYQNSGPVTSAQIPQKFRSEGTYTYRATATDANGRTSTASTVIFVTP